MSGLVGRSISGKIRLHEGQVFLAEHDDDRPCKCCATSCATEVTVEVTFCDYTATLEVPIPGSANFNQDLDGAGPGESYLVIDAVITCTPCGWLLVVNVCGYCEDPYSFASDAWSALIPFAAAAESGGGYCPEAGAVALECFGLEFGVPCVTNTTATIV